MKDDLTPDPAPTGGDSTSAPTQDLGAGVAPGGRIGPYFVLRQIGEGGMGEVWLAEQREPIRRKVALKVIKRGLDTKQVVARFEAERQALALMNHPCLARVYDAGSTADGRPYFAMEYVQGMPINEHCDRHRVSVPDRLRLFLQVCEGVQHAHHQSVLHRDLKPSNVLVTMQEGHAVPKIIDFGIAKATAQPLTDRTLQTELGVLVGTPEYMSPEQAETTAEDVDGRTDVYSLGVMLYEQLTGTLPFDPKTLRAGGVAAMRRRICDEDPPKPTARLLSLGDNESSESARRRQADPPALRRLLSGDLDWITMKALEKDRLRRYDSPAALAEDIERFLAGRPVKAGPPGVAYRVRKLVRRHANEVGAAAVLATVMVAAIVWWRMHPTPPPAPASDAAAIDSVAILPLENKDADPESEYLSEGITETIINKVSQIPTVKVICRDSAFQYKGPHVDPGRAARELKVRAVLTGTLQRRGQDLVVSATLVDYQQNQRSAPVQLWGDRFTTNESRLLDVEEQIASAISRGMGLRLTPQTQDRFSRQQTDSPEAHTFYLKGRHVLKNAWGTKSGAQQAIALFNQAIQADPGYALAYAGLSDAYYSLSNIQLSPTDAMPRAKAAALNALELDDALGAAHVSLGVIKQSYEWDLDGGERELRRAIELAPSNADAHLMLGLSLLVAGKSDEAEAETAQAVEFDPLNPYLRGYRAMALYEARQYGKAESELKSLLAERPEFQVAHAFLGLVYEQMGRPRDAVDQFRTAVRLDESTEARAQLGHALAVAGQREEARRVLADLEKDAASRYVNPFSLGLIETALGNRDRAFTWFDRAVEDHSEWFFFLPVDPRVDVLRSDPRFKALLQRVGIQPVDPKLPSATRRA